MQQEMILRAMFNRPDKKFWSAKDFMQGEYFVGYEASARMSELLKLYPNALISAKDGRYRILSINWEAKEEIDLIMERIGNNEYRM